MNHICKLGCPFSRAVRQIVMVDAAIMERFQTNASESFRSHIFYTSNFASESDVCRSQILTTKDGPSAERIKKLEWP